ncbi:MAG: hypothetical protein ACRC4N_03185 [Gammaproteobacteria bacterium]
MKYERVCVCVCVCVDAFASVCQADRLPPDRPRPSMAELFK